jgi:rubrerythrin
MALYEALHELPLVATFGPEPAQTLVERLFEAVRRHIQAESDALSQYERIAEESGDPVIALVMRLVLQDEERHHGLLERIADSLRDALEWSHSPGALPAGQPFTGERAAALAGVTRELIEEERHGAKALRDLAHKERTIADGLHSLLLEMMAVDSDKHAHLLQFVERRLRSAIRP